MFEKVLKIPKKPLKIVEKLPKIRKKHKKINKIKAKLYNFFSLKNYLKKYLMRFNSMSEEDSIDEYIKEKVTYLVNWIAELFVNGLIIQCMLFVPYYLLNIRVPLKYLIFFIFSYGLMIDLYKRIKEFSTECKIKINNALPRMRRGEQNG